ncbi:MAG TPA: hypothetical protein PKE29_12785 [Phycisphaerales bacterium]|nr:hypothetical protein [Phycisphaerales bacterium]
MALGDDVALPFEPTTKTPTVVVPCSGISQWTKAISAGGLTLTDAGGAVIVDPDAQITDITRHVLICPGFGGVFGKHHDQDFWVALRNLNGDASVPIQISPGTDTVLGSADAAHTVPDNNAHSWDIDGCDRIIIGVEKPYAPASGGHPANAVLWAKVV